MKIVKVPAGMNQTLIQSETEVTYKVEERAELDLVVPILDKSNAQLSVIVELIGRGASALITGVVIGRGNNQIQLHTLQHHLAPETTSDLLVKGVLFERAKLAYDGKIVVDKVAQKTDAYQRNENLLMGLEAKAESKPGLEILANDVRCTHGATVGMIDEEQIWYLMSRGLGKNESEKLILSGFISSGISRIRDESVRVELEEKVDRLLYKLN